MIGFEWIWKFADVIVVPFIGLLAGLAWKIHAAIGGRMAAAEKQMTALRQEFADYKVVALQQFAMRADVKDIENEIKASLIRFEGKLDRIVETLRQGST